MNRLAAYVDQLRYFKDLLLSLNAHHFSNDIDATRLTYTHWLNTKSRTVSSTAAALKKAHQSVEPETRVILCELTSTARRVDRLMGSERGSRYSEDDAKQLSALQTKLDTSNNN